MNIDSHFILTDSALTEQIETVHLDKIRRCSKNPAAVVVGFLVAGKPRRLLYNSPVFEAPGLFLSQYKTAGGADQHTLRIRKTEAEPWLVNFISSLNKRVLAEFIPALNEFCKADAALANSLSVLLKGDGAGFMKHLVHDCTGDSIFLDVDPGAIIYAQRGGVSTTIEQDNVENFVKRVKQPLPGMYKISVMARFVYAGKTGAAQPQIVVNLRVAQIAVKESVGLSAPMECVLDTSQIFGGALAASSGAGPWDWLENSLPDGQPGKITKKKKKQTE